MSETIATAIDLERVLGPIWSPRARALEAWMTDSALGIGSLETSIRRNVSGLTGGRMMIERARPDRTSGFFRALEMALPPMGRDAIAAAEALSLDMIVGWDATAGVAKLYVNASDSSAPVRAELARSLGVAGQPNVVGLNIGPQVERKVYTQSGRPPGSIHEFLRPFVACDAIGGWVVSQTVGEVPTARAIFAALRMGHPDVPALLEALPGWSRAAFDRVAAFGLGVVTSLGFSAHDPAVWTLYWKPPGIAPVGWALDPVLVVRERGAEIGVFVEPSRLGRQAFVTVGEHALSYRVRAGHVDAARVATLMGWAADRLRAGVAPTALAHDTRPPEPWDVVQLP